MKIALVSLTAYAYTVGQTVGVSAFMPTAPCANKPRSSTALEASRRSVLSDAAAGVAAVASLALTAAAPPRANAAAAAVQDSLQVDDFLRTGVDSGGTMGVSSQAGKSRPQTGVVFRDGTDVLQVRVLAGESSPFVCCRAVSLTLGFCPFRRASYSGEERRRERRNFGRYEGDSDERPRFLQRPVQAREGWVDSPFLPSRRTRR